MARFGPHDNRDDAVRATDTYTKLLAEMRDGFDEEFGGLTWTVPEGARTYTFHDTHETCHIGPKQWGRPSAGAIDLERCLRVLNSVLPKFGFPQVQPWPQDWPFILNATSVAPDGARFQYQGRAEVSFWVEIPLHAN